MATQCTLECTFGHFLGLGLVFKLLSLFCITAATYILSFIHSFTQDLHGQTGTEIYSVVSNRFKTLEFLEFSGFHAEKSQYWYIQNHARPPHTVRYCTVCPVPHKYQYTLEACYALLPRQSSMDEMV